jgi:hypothetical protein
MSKSVSFRHQDQAMGHRVIVSLYPERPFLPPRPGLVSDILRTGYCAPGTVFLVEGIDSCIPIDKTQAGKDRAVRLLLGDGKLCIQALLSPAAYNVVDVGTVDIGWYVRVQRFELKRLRQGGGKDMGHQKMVYLLVKDLLPVGWDTRYIKMIAANKQMDQSIKDSLDQHGNVQPQASDSVTAIDPPVKMESEGDARGVPSKDRATTTATTAEMDDKQDPDDDGKDDIFEQMTVSATRASQRRQDVTVDLKESEPIQQEQNLQAASVSLPWTSDDPRQPLKLAPLRSIPTLPYKQNWAVNVLAIVASLSDVEPSHLPPYRQRTARLADPSTEKRVLLTVFLDPEQFCPKIGSVVLLLGVKNHRFDGGSLKKYSSDKPKKGGCWWFEDPTDLGWCDCEGLRKWWNAEQESLSTLA